VGLNGHEPTAEEWAWRRYQSAERRAGRYGAPLSPRETEIIHLIAKGNSNKQVAGHLGCSEQTVKNHMGSLLKKLGVADRTAAVVKVLGPGFGAGPRLESMLVSEARRQLDYVAYALGRLDERLEPADTDRAPEPVYVAIGASRALSARELQVLRTYAQSSSINEAAEKLGISPQTVKNHLSASYEQLGVRSNTEAIVKVFCPELAIAPQDALRADVVQLRKELAALHVALDSIAQHISEAASSRPAEDSSAVGPRVVEEAAPPRGPYPPMGSGPFPRVPRSTPIA
jgi:DNA-binding NarL/FixJ family response regulator